MATSAIEIPGGRIVQQGGLSKSLVKTIKAAVKSAAVATTCDWLVCEGYACDLTHARELVESALNQQGNTLTDYQNATTQLEAATVA